MANERQAIISATKWNENNIDLKEWVNKKTQLPAIIKIVKGQYSGLGAPSLPNPGLQSICLVISAGKRRNLIAQTIKLKDGKQVTINNQQLIFPETYKGYFELLSEDGRSIKCIDTVSDLSKRTDCGFLVRDTIRCLVRNNEANTEEARLLHAGETLFPISECKIPRHKNTFLRCLDSRGDDLLIGLEQKGKFSIIAKEDNISGVHCTRNLLSKRLPITVRIVHGSIPKGLKISDKYILNFRIINSYEEENIYAIPLQKDSIPPVYLPLGIPLKLQTAKNMDQLICLNEYQKVLENCKKLVNDVQNKAQIIDAKLVSKKIFKLHQLKSNEILFRKNSSSDLKKLDDNIVLPIKDDYEDIDRIYDYIRGFAPLPKHIKSPYSDFPSDNKKLVNSDSKPEPPPIETIPTKKQQYCLLDVNIKPDKRKKETSHTKNSKIFSGSIYIKNISNQQHSRQLKQKTETVKEHNTLFGLRYKSMNNLYNQVELDGTLNSSHSGGKISGDSVGKLPEKRSRILHRPLSLNNLAWNFGRLPPTQHQIYCKNYKSKNNTILYL